MEEALNQCYLEKNDCKLCQVKSELILHALTKEAHLQNVLRDAVFTKLEGLISRVDLVRSRKHLATHYSHVTSTRSVQLLQSGAIANQAKTVALWAEAQKERHKTTLLVSRLLASMRRPYLTRKVFSAAATFHLLRNRVSRTQRAFSLATRKKVLHTTLARQARSPQLTGVIQLHSQH